MAALGRLLDLLPADRDSAQRLCKKDIAEKPPCQVGGFLVDLMAGILDRFNAGDGGGDPGDIDGGAIGDEPGW